MTLRINTLVAAGTTVAIATFSIGMIVSPKAVRSASSTFESGLSASELDMMFGKDRPKKIGPHPVIYLTAEEAKQIKGKNPVAIGVIGGAIGGGIAGGMQAYDNGTSIGYGVAIGAVSGGVAGAFVPLGGGWGSVAGTTLGGAAGGATGLFMGGSAGVCYQCHEAKK